jgi:peptidoglycan/LPS O-acetylase OafA/YrhL
LGAQAHRFEVFIALFPLRDSTNRWTVKNMATREPHIAALDGIRGIAITLVVAVHMLGMGFLPRVWPHLTAAALRSGWAGVDLFFVLSGFLITGILLDTSDHPQRAKRFYTRRALRIFPLFYLLVLSAMAATPWLRTLPIVGRFVPSWREWLAYLGYLQNWVIPVTGHTIIGHFWSLGVEEQFYILWPWCVWWTPRKHLPQLCAVGIAAGLILRLVGLWAIPVSIRLDIVRMTTLCRMDTLLFGALCAIIVRSPRWGARVNHLLRGPVWTGCLVCLAITYYAVGRWRGEWWSESFGFTALAVGFSLLVLGAYYRNNKGTGLDRLLRSPVLTAAGKYSYGIYVYHLPIFVIFRKWAGQSMGQAFLFCAFVCGVSIAVAVFSYHYYELPFLRLKKSLDVPRTALSMNAG